MDKRPLGITESRDGDGRRATDVELAALKDAPWPVKAVAILGGMTCIACFLVWFLSVRVTIALDEIKAQTAPIAAHVKGVEQLGISLQSLEKAHQESDMRLESYLRILCVQNAHNDGQRNTCLSVR